MAAQAAIHARFKIRLVESMNPERTNLLDAATGEIRLGPADVGREVETIGKHRLTWMAACAAMTIVLALAQAALRGFLHRGGDLLGGIAQVVRGGDLQAAFGKDFLAQLD